MDNENTNNPSKIITTMACRTRIMKRGNILCHKSWARNLKKTLKVLSPSLFVTITSNQKCS